MNRLCMKLGLGITWCCLLAPLIALGHVGSPNVFFEGQAGSHPVRVIIRPPAVLPGIAQVDVRVAADGVTNVWLQAALFQAGDEAAPPPVPAVAVAGETNLFNASLWLLRSGFYSLRVTVQSSQGQGRAMVPLNSVATKRPVMPPLLGAALAGLAVMLLLGACWLAGAVARDGSLEPGAMPAFREHARARVVTLVAALVLAASVYAGKARWQSMDREFRNNALYKPVPVDATVRTNGNVRLLRLTMSSETSAGPAWDTLVADHGKLMHLFLLSDPDFNVFAHLHPVRRDARTFENVLPPLPAGGYQLYAEITQENGLSQTLVANVSLAVPVGRVPQLMRGSNMLNEVFCQSFTTPIGNAAQPFALDTDDSWHVNADPPQGPLSSRPASTGAKRGEREPAHYSPRQEQSRLTSAATVQSSGPHASPLMGGRRMVFKNTEDLMENRETSLRFAVVDAQGQPAVLQPYMGMLSHAVVRRSGGEVFTHLHPLGTISMAAQELFQRAEQGANTPSNPLPATNPPSATLPRPSGGPANEVAFPYAFPRAGDYRLWVQVRTSDRVLTGVFDVAVKPAKSSSL